MNKINSSDKGPEELLINMKIYGDDHLATTFVCLISILNLICIKQDSWFPPIPQHISLSGFSTTVNGRPPLTQLLDTKPRIYSLSLSFLYLPYPIHLQVLSTSLLNYTLNPITSLHFHCSLANSPSSQARAY